MKIIKLQAENIKRLIAVEIEPKSNLVKITGKNGNGKTSVLDSIWWGLAGTENIQSNPIHGNADCGFIQIDLGEMVVTRTFKQGKTSSLKVEGKDGSKFSSPQTMLDKMLGDLTFDPLEFSRMPEKKQFDIMRKFVKGVDFDEIDTANKYDYETRTDLNRKYASKIAEANAITAVKSERVDVSDLLNKINSASKHNSDIEIKRANRSNLINREVELRERARQLLVQAEEIKNQIGKQVPDPIDISSLSEEIKRAEEINRSVDLYERKVKLTQEAEQLKNKSDELTKSIESRNNAKQEAIKKSSLPIEGITFGDGEIILNGQPFNQASDAEKLKTSLAIAIALNPKLKVIRVRDGSLLDEDSMKFVEEIADKNDFQVWMEIVDSSGKIGFVIEDGKLKTDEEEVDF